MLNIIKKYLKDPTTIIIYLCFKGFFNFLSDKTFLKLLYYLRMRKKLDIKHPKTFNEKLQWLKLYDRNPIYTTLVDKYSVKDYIAKTIGEEYVIPNLGVWESYKDIDFDILPEQFILKTTHDSGGICICKDKSSFNKEQAKKKIKKSFKRNYYVNTKEWPYKNVKPRIIAEKLLETKDGSLPIDYKFSCFNGSADNVMLCLGRGTGKTKFYFFNKDWNLLRYNIAGKAAPEDFTLPKPAKIKEMFELAERLSKGIPYVRVDLYYENDKIYFGEFTFYPDSGYDKNLLQETDILFGDKIILGEKKNENNRIYNQQKRK